MFSTYIGNCFDGHNKAYIYIWLSKQEQILYVGMTNSFAGTIGRAGGHFDYKGTLRKRFLERKGFYINPVTDLVLITFDLPRSKIFTTSEKSYREAVEYLVQKKLQLIRNNFNPTFEIISWVRANPRTSSRYLDLIADSIVIDFVQEYPDL